MLHKNCIKIVSTSSILNCLVILHGGECWAQTRSEFLSWLADDITKTHISN